MTHPNWRVISAKVPVDRYEKYLEIMERTSTLVPLENNKGEVTISSFVTFCLDRITEIVEGKYSNKKEDDSITLNITISKEKYREYKRCLNSIDRELTLNILVKKYLDKVVKAVVTKEKAEKELKELL